MGFLSSARDMWLPPRGFLCVRVKSYQSCPILCDPMDCSSQSSSVHGILQAVILEWVAISFSRGSSQPRDWTLVPCIAGGFFTEWTTRETRKERSISHWNEVPISRCCFFLILGGKHCSSLWTIMLTAEFGGKHYLSSGGSTPSCFLRLFILNVLHFSNAFSSTDRVMSFSFFSLWIRCTTLIYCQILNQLCIPTISPD